MLAERSSTVEGQTGGIKEIQIVPLRKYILGGGQSAAKLANLPPVLLEEDLAPVKKPEKSQDPYASAPEQIGVALHSLRELYPNIVTPTQILEIMNRQTGQWLPRLVHRNDGKRNWWNIRQRETDQEVAAFYQGLDGSNELDKAILFFTAASAVRTVLERSQNLMAKAQLHEVPIAFDLGLTHTGSPLQKVRVATIVDELTKTGIIEAKTTIPDSKIPLLLQVGISSLAFKAQQLLLFLPRKKERNTKKLEEFSSRQTQHFSDTGQIRQEPSIFVDFLSSPTKLKIFGSNLTALCQALIEADTFNYYRKLAKEEYPRRNLAKKEKTKKDAEQKMAAALNYANFHLARTHLFVDKYINSVQINEIISPVTTDNVLHYLRLSSEDYQKYLLILKSELSLRVEN